MTSGAYRAIVTSSSSSFTPTPHKNPINKPSKHRVWALGQTLISLTYRRPIRGASLDDGHTVPRLHLRATRAHLREARHGNNGCCRKRCRLHQGAGVAGDTLRGTNTVRREHCAARTLCSTNTVRHGRFAAARTRLFAARTLCGTNTARHEHCAARTLRGTKRFAARTLCNTIRTANSRYHSRTTYYTRRRTESTKKRVPRFVSKQV